MAPQEDDKTGHGRREIDEIIVPILAAGLPYRVAARAAGVGLSTVKRRMASAKFRAKVAAHRARAVEQAAGRITAVMVDAVDELRQQLRDPDVRVRQFAVRSLLGFGTELWKAADRQVILDEYVAFRAKLLREQPHLFRNDTHYATNEKETV